MTEQPVAEREPLDRAAARPRRAPERRRRIGRRRQRRRSRGSRSSPGCSVWPSRPCSSSRPAWCAPPVAGVVSPVTSRTCGSSCGTCAVDLGHAWPHGRSPRRAGAWLGRLLGTADDRTARPDRPRRGRDQAPEAAQALDRLVLALEQQPLRPRPGDLHRRAVPRGRRAGRGVPGRRRHAPRRTTRRLVAGLGRWDGVRRGAAPARSPARPGTPVDRDDQPDGRRAHRLTGHCRARGAADGSARTLWVRSRARGGDATAPPCAP